MKTKPIQGYEGTYEVDENGVVTRIGFGVMTPFPNSKGYLRVRLSRGGNKKWFFVHRIVAREFLGITVKVDHHDRNPLNNHYSNLRACTHCKNMQNATISSRNKSGVKGVFFNTKTGRWMAYINAFGKRTYLGNFIDKATAAIRRRAAELKQHGEFAVNA